MYVSIIPSDSTSVSTAHPAPITSVQSYNRMPLKSSSGKLLTAWVSRCLLGSSSTIATPCPVTLVMVPKGFFWTPPPQHVSACSLLKVLRAGRIKGSDAAKGTLPGNETKPQIESPRDLWINKLLSSLCGNEQRKSQRKENTSAHQGRDGGAQGFRGQVGFNAHISSYPPAKSIDPSSV